MFGGNDDLLTDSAGNAVLFIKDPEQVVNHELGIRYTTATTSVYINYYLMQFKNEIVLDGKFGPNGLALTNDVEKSFRTGVEVTWAVKPAKNLSLLNNSSFNYSRIKEQGIAFAPILTPAVIINQQAAYSSKTVTLALAGRYQSSSYIDFANSSRLKSYFLLNARIACERKKIQLAAFINNITGSRYFNNGYVDFDGTKKYFVQAPVNYSVAVKYSF
jgi:iron complex outermembrane recepter protein